MNNIIKRAKAIIPMNFAFCSWFDVSRANEVLFEQIFGVQAVAKVCGTW